MLGCQIKNSASRIITPPLPPTMFFNLIITELGLNVGPAGMVCHNAVASSSQGNCSGECSSEKKSFTACIISARASFRGGKVVPCQLWLFLNFTNTLVLNPAFILQICNSANKTVKYFFTFPNEEATWIMLCYWRRSNYPHNYWLQNIFARRLTHYRGHLHFIANKTNYK